MKTARTCPICGKQITIPRVKFCPGECIAEHTRRTNRKRMQKLRGCGIAEQKYGPIEDLLIEACFAGGDPKRAKAWLGLRDEVTKGCKRDGRVKYSEAM